MLCFNLVKEEDKVKESTLEVISIDPFYEEKLLYYVKDCHDCIGMDKYSPFICDFKCYAPYMDADNCEYLIAKDIPRISERLYLKEGRLTCVQNDKHEEVYLDGELVGIWNIWLFHDFSRTCYDVSRFRRHEEMYCGECNVYESCKYGSSVESNFYRKLLSDELNLPIFSIQRLLDMLNATVTLTC